MNYNEQLRIITKLSINTNITKRINCPFCYGKNTLGITKSNGELLWHCFKNSCNAHGKSEIGKSINDIKTYFKKSTEKVNLRPIPDNLFSISNHNNIINYLIKYNSYESYKQNLVTIKYNPAEDRVMFAIRDNDPKSINYNQILGYTGRSLSNQIPKWLKYGNTENLFTCGKGKIGVLVEDALSACAVGILEDYIGLSLLGTSLTSSHRNQLLDYDKIIICLDPDASLKAIKFNKHIPNSIIRFIPNDLKYFKPDQIMDIIK